MESSQVASVGEQYWAARPAFEMVGQLFSRAPSQGGVFGIDTRIVYARRYFYGSMPYGTYLGGVGVSSLAIGATGEQGEIATLKVNWARNYAEARHQIVTNPDLSWTAQAVNSDARSMSDAKRAQDILEYVWKTSGAGRRAIDAVLGAIVDGEEFVFVDWDPEAGPDVAADPDSKRVIRGGDVRFRNVPSWDVLRDSSVNAYEDCQWLCARLYVSRWELVARYPEMRAQILKAGSVSPPQMTLTGLGPTSDPDKVSVHHFFHQKTAALPDGRRTVFVAGDCVLEDGPLPPECDPIPIHRMAAGELKNTPFPDTDFWEIMASQQLADDIQGSLATNIMTFGKGMVAVPEGSNPPVDQFTDGPKIIQVPEGKSPPMPINFLPAQNQHFQHLANLKTDMRQIMGLNDVVLGQPQGSQLNAQAFALLASMSIQQNSDLQKRYVDFVTGIGRSVLKMFRARASVPRKIAVSGLHGPGTVRQDEFSGKDLESIDDVYVEIGNPLSQTAAGRLSLAQMYAQQGFVQVPEQLQAVVETGRLEPLTQGLRDELIYVAEENEELLKGNNPAVKILDSHVMHIKEHRNVSFNLEARDNPEVNRALDAHIQAHLEFLLNPANQQLFAATGQASIPPKPPAGQAPPPGEVANQLQSQVEGGSSVVAPDGRTAKVPQNPLTGGRLGGMQ